MSVRISQGRGSARDRGFSTFFLYEQGADPLRRYPSGCDTSPTAGHTFADADNPEDIELRAYEDFFRGEINLPANLLMPSGSLVARLDPVYVREQFGVSAATTP